jgi:hypothetical protein
MRKMKKMRSERFFVVFEKIDSLENRINADTRKAYFNELQKMS